MGSKKSTRELLLLTDGFSGTERIKINEEFNFN